MKKCLNGILLSKNGDKTEIANALKLLMDMDPAEYDTMRHYSRVIWKKHFDIKKNQQIFCKSSR